MIGLLFPSVVLCQLSAYYNEVYRTYRFEDVQIARSTFFADYGRSDLNLTDEDAMHVYFYERDTLGQDHYKYLRYYKNILVENSLYFLHSDSDDDLLLAHGNLVPNLNLSAEPTLTTQEAIEKAIEHIGAEEYAWQNDSMETEIKSELGAEATYYPSPELVFSSIEDTYDPSDYRLCYKMEIFTSSDSNNYFVVYIDAEDGNVFKSYGSQNWQFTTKPTGKDGHMSGGCEDTDRTEHIAQTHSCNPFTGGAVITPNDGYQNITIRENATNFSLVLCNKIYAYKVIPLNGNGALINDGNGYWPANDNNRDAATAFWAVGKTWDYFQNTHNRNGLDGNGRKIELGYKMVAGNSMFFSKKTDVTNKIITHSSISFCDDCSAPDALAHEYTHGVIDFAANINNVTIGTFENKCLREGICDIFGELVERFIRGTNNWIIGNEIASHINKPGGNRNFMEPEQTSPTPLPSYYNGNNWSATSEHINAGVVDHWFYLLSEGGTHHVSSVDVGGIGIDKAAKIVYRTLNLYFEPSHNFVDFRNWTYEAARDLFGYCSVEAREVLRAWEACGVGTTEYCATFGATKGNVLYCMENSFTQKVHHNLLNSPTYSWTATSGVSISNQVNNQATFSNLQMPNTQINVTVSQSNPTINLSLSRTIGVTSCRLKATEQAQSYVFPNPADKMVEVFAPCEGFEYRLTNTLGQVVLRGNVSGRHTILQIAG